MEAFIVVKALTRRYGYAIQAPRCISWATGPRHTFGWYRRKVDAQQRADVLNRCLAEIEFEASAGARSSRP